MKRNREALLIDMTRNGPIPAEHLDEDELKTAVQLESEGLIETCLRLTSTGRIVAKSLLPGVPVPSRPEIEVPKPEAKP